MDKLPQEVWTDKDLKWLDPAAGIGIFPLIVHTRLMISLREEIPDVEKRRKYILEDMLYMAELERKNIEILKWFFVMIMKTFKYNILHIWIMKEIPKLGRKIDWSKDVKILSSEISKCYGLYWLE